MARVDGRDLGADVGEVGQPAGAFVAEIVARRAAGEAHRGRPQRVVGRRHQHLVAVALSSACMAITISSETPLPM
jgi:hypothetical protein